MTHVILSHSQQSYMDGQTNRPIHPSVLRLLGSDGVLPENSENRSSFQRW